MEKTKDTFTTNGFTPFIFNTLKSKFFFFAIGFIGLIFLSNNYSKRQSFTHGSVASEEVQKNTTPRQANERAGLSDKVVEFALNQLGTKYTPAGKSPSSGFDCSGFTYYVFKNFSIDIPSSSLTQSEFGEEVQTEEARKGDLIFFKSPTAGNNNIGHVGIVISDLGEKVFFVHSSSNRGVVIDSLDQHHYKNRYRLIRRVIQE